MNTDLILNQSINPPQGFYFRFTQKILEDKVHNVALGIFRKIIDFFLTLFSAGYRQRESRLRKEMDIQSFAPQENTHSKSHYIDLACKAKSEFTPSKHLSSALDLAKSDKDTIALAKIRSGKRERVKKHLQIISSREELIQRRRVILLGKSRIGKSVVANTLKNPCFVPQKSSIFSGTKTPSIVLVDLKKPTPSLGLEALDVNFKKTRKAVSEQFNALDLPLPSSDLRIEVLDPPGIGDTTRINDSREQMTDACVEQMTDRFVENHFGGYNVDQVFFACNFDSGIDSKQIDAIDLFQKKLSKDTRADLLITNFERFPSSRKKDIESELSHHKFFNSRKEEGWNYKVLYSGNIDMKSKDFYAKKELKYEHQEVLTLRENLIQHIYNTENETQKYQLPVIPSCMRDEDYGLESQVQKLIDEHPGSIKFKKRA